MKTFFENIFKNMPVPVIVCGASAQHPVVYMNTAAKITINPLLSISDMTGRAKGDYLADVLTFKDRDTLDIIFRALAGVGAVADFKADIAGADSGFIPVSVTASRVVTGEDAYYILYLYTGKGAAEVRIDVDRIVASVFDMSYNIADTNEAINAILGYIGNCIHVSRVYIFEDASDIYTKNTYEWCAKDIEPAIQDLQSLKKEDYNYDVIIKEGVYITDDIRSLPPEDRDILAMQGIKSLAIIALQHAGPAIGYVGFDDCAEYRVWSGEEISLLKKIASILVSLIERRKADEKAARSLDIMKTISNNIDSIVYVNAIKSYDLIFVNEALAQSLGKSNEALIGQPCWKVLQLGQTGPCSFCPMKKMLDADGNVVNESYRWEFKNTVTDKWFMVKDAIIKWIDGSDVHIETATEITSQKQYEEQLMQAASIDMMTGAYNREWGYKVIGEAVAAMQHDDIQLSLCFLDLDGLKITNDTHGHDVGDEMIIRTVETIRACIRQSDIVCRWGGDEFIVLLRCAGHNAEKVIQKIQNKAERFNAAEKRLYTISFSYGIVEIERGDDEISLDTLIASADKRMYRNKMEKRQGRTR